MKVLHVAETIKGGVATVINELAEKQISDSFFDEVRVLVPASQVAELTFKDCGNILTFERTGRNFYSFFKLATKFISTINDFKPDVIHLHSTFAGFICRVIFILNPFIKIDVVYCPHAFSFMMLSSSIKKKIFILVERILQYKTKKIICVSRHEYNEAIKYGMNKDKLTIVYNGISKKSNSFDSNFLDCKVNTNKNKFTVLFVGRFDYQKGYDLLCEAIDRLSKKKLDIKFTLVGGYVNDEGVDICFDPKNVERLGWKSKEEVFSIYKKADLLVIPSRWEGFAMVPIEAFSEGLPVLASDFPSFDEIIQDGESGFTFKNGDVNDFCLKIVEIYSLHDRQKQLSRIQSNAFKIYNMRFTADIMSDNTKLVYLNSNGVS